MSLRIFLNRLYWKLEKLIDPGVPSSQQLYAETLDQLVNPETAWLDLGCGHALYADWIGGEQELVRRARMVVGIDYEFDAVTKHTTIERIVAGDLNKLPFANAAFDLISANMVVEHIANPSQALAEVNRVLRKGGLFLFHTPNFRDPRIILAAILPQWIKNLLVRLMEGRSEADIFPTFYRMNTQSRIEQTAPASGFTVRELRFVRTSAAGDIMLGPLVVPLLIWRRITGMERFRNLRSNVLVTLVKRDDVEPLRPTAAWAAPSSQAK